MRMPHLHSAQSRSISDQFQTSCATHFYSYGNIEQSGLCLPAAVSCPRLSLYICAAHQYRVSPARPPRLPAPLTGSRRQYGHPGLLQVENIRTEVESVFEFSLTTSDDKQLFAYFLPLGQHVAHSFLLQGNVVGHLHLEREKLLVETHCW